MKDYNDLNKIYNSKGCQIFSGVLICFYCYLSGWIKTDWDFLQLCLLPLVYAMIQIGYALIMYRFETGEKEDVK